MSHTWKDVFRESLGLAERGLVSELCDWRNKWAHQERFVSDDAYRVLDSVQRLTDLKLIVHTKPCPITTTVFFYERAQ